MARKKKVVDEATTIEQESTDLAPKEVKPVAQVEMTGTGIVEVPLEKTDAFGAAPKRYKATSGRKVTVFSKYEQALKYETPYGPIVLACKTHKGALVVNGFAVTSIPIEAWNYLAEVYGKSNMFRNHFVYVADSVEAGTDHAKELRDIKTGLEPLDPKEKHNVLPSGQSDDGIVTTFTPD